MFLRNWMNAVLLATIATLALSASAAPNQNDHSSTSSGPTAVLPAGDTVYGYWGLEMQVYPTGLLPGIQWERGFGRGHHLHLRVGANLFDHRDLGEQDTERGWGFGGGAGWRWYLPRRGEHGPQGWLIGARADVWRNTVDWSNERVVVVYSGTTKLWVLQPTLEAGYRFAFGQNWALSPHLGFGWEWNAVTDGQPTGQGAILIGGVRLAYRSCRRPK